MARLGALRKRHRTEINWTCDGLPPHHWFPPNRNPKPRSPQTLFVAVSWPHPAADDDVAAAASRAFQVAETGSVQIFYGRIYAAHHDIHFGAGHHVRC